MILNLGQLVLAKSKWKVLADAIESKLHNTPKLLDIPCDEEIEGLADHFAK